MKVKGDTRIIENKKITYWGGYREVEKCFEFYLYDFYLFTAFALCTP